MKHSLNSARRSPLLLGLRCLQRVWLGLMVLGFCGAPFAKASFLAPGGIALTPTAYGVGQLPGTFITELLPVPIVTQLGYTATLNSMVILDGNTGYLDFLYQVINDASSLDDLNQLRIADYVGVGSVAYGAGILDVGFIDGVSLVQAGILGAPSKPIGTNDPSFISRSSNGIRVTGNFTGPGSLLTPGDSSSWLVIRTDFSTFAVGTGSVVNNLQSNIVSVLAPIPEPSTALMGVGLTLFCGLGRALRPR